MLRTLLMLSLFLPVSATAIPVTLTVLQGKTDGFKYSHIHTADDCEANGYYMCGTKIDDLDGVLTADMVGTAFTNIVGQLSLGFAGVYDVTGSLDFSAPAGGLIGTLAFAITDAGQVPLGTFEFYNENFPGPPNSLAGAFIYLWGQNFPAGQPSDFNLGADIVFEWEDGSGPEPAALAMLLGAAGVAYVARRRRV